MSIHVFSEQGYIWIKHRFGSKCLHMRSIMNGAHWHVIICTVYTFAGICDLLNSSNLSIVEHWQWLLSYFRAGHRSAKWWDKHQTINQASDDQPMIRNIERESDTLCKATAEIKPSKWISRQGSQVIAHPCINKKSVNINTNTWIYHGKCFVTIQFKHNLITSLPI